MGMGFGGSDFMFTFVPIIIGIGFVFIFGSIIFAAIKGGIQWDKNNNSPLLTVPVKVVAKRASVSQHSHHDNDNMAMNHTSSSTTYFITFEVESGDRLELLVPSSQYGMIVEGDIGKLTFQGTRYKGFEREKL